MTYDKPTEPGWYWATSTRYPDKLLPIHVTADGPEAGMLAGLRYSSAFVEEGRDPRPLSDAPEHLMWGPRIPEPRFSFNPQWEEP